MKAITITQFWVLDFVIGLNLCPFARKPFNNHQIRFTTSGETHPEELLLAFWEEVLLLLKTPKEEISNTLFVLHKVKWDFDTFLDVYYVAEELLREQGLQEQVQLAGFHPEFRFEKSAFEEPVNFVNRSPFPMIHILRVDEVAAAVESHPDAAGITDRNREILGKLGFEELKKRLKMVSRETEN